MHPDLRQELDRLGLQTVRGVSVGHGNPTAQQVAAEVARVDAAVAAGYAFPGKMFDGRPRPVKEVLYRASSDLFFALKVSNRRGIGKALHAIGEWCCR